MALLWIDGFEGYGSVAAAVMTGLAGRYAAVGNSGYALVGVGRICGYGFLTSNGFNYTPSVTTPNLTTDSTLIAGCAFVFLRAGTSNTLAFNDNAALGISLYLAQGTTNSSIAVKLGATTIATYTNFLFSLNVWYYIELKVFCHATSGTVEVRIDGVTVLSLTGINTKAGIDSWYNNVSITVGNGSCADDFYVCDSSGSSLNDFQGVCKVLGIFPNADTSTVQWTPSAAVPHYSLVDENPYTTADYVSTSTQANTDLYTYPSLIGTGTILGIQVNTTVLLSAGTSAIFEAPIISNGITALGPDTTVTSAVYIDMRHLSTTDPNTGLPWTISNLSAAQIGMRMM